MKIQAAVFRSKNPTQLSLELVDLEEPRDDEVLVRMVATGICHTDVKMLHSPAPLPTVFGHEGAGVVEKIGSRVTRIFPGDHVVLTFNSCGGCPCCLRTESAYCHNSRALNFGGVRPDGSSPLSKDGKIIAGNFFGQSSFASYVIANQRNAVRVPRDAPLELLGPFGCGFQTGAGAVINSLAVRPGKSVGIFGVGAVGLSAVMAASLVGAGPIIAIDIVRSRLAAALELGATDVIDASIANPRAMIMQLTGKGLDFSLETTADLSTIQQAIESLAPLGVCGVLASSPKFQTVPFDLLHLIGGGRTIRGIVEGDSKPQTFIPALIDFWTHGRLPFDKLVRFYAFERIHEAIQHMETGEVIKPILRFSTPKEDSSSPDGIRPSTG